MIDIIKKPLVTEKNTYHQAVGMYVFECYSEATKVDIKNAVQKMFGVKVDSVNTSNCRGKSKKSKFGLGKVPYWKKAIVKLKAGEKIALFEGA
jgi:large subunit ribosomal protein L23